MRREFKFKLHVKQRVTTTTAASKLLQKLEETPAGLIPLADSQTRPFPGLPGPIPEGSCAPSPLGLQEASPGSPPSRGCSLIT